jgi:hypothetical protein
MRYDVTRPRNLDCIAHVQIQIDQVLQVEQAGSLNERSAQPRRCKQNHGRNLAGPTHLKVDLNDLGHTLASRKLVGHGPAGRACRAAHRPLLRHGIDFKYHPVNVKWERRT